MGDNQPPVDEVSPDQAVRDAIAANRKAMPAGPVVPLHVARRSKSDALTSICGGALITLGIVLAIAPYAPMPFGAEALEVTTNVLAPDLIAHDIVYLTDSVEPEVGKVVSLQAPNNELILDRIISWDGERTIGLSQSGELPIEAIVGTAAFSLHGSPLELAPLVRPGNTWFAIPLILAAGVLAPWKLWLKSITKAKKAPRGRRTASADYIARLKREDTPENRAMLAKERRASRILNVPAESLEHIQEAGTLNCFTVTDRTRSIILDDASGVLEFGPPEGVDAAIEAFLDGQRTLVTV